MEFLGTANRLQVDQILDIVVSKYTGGAGGSNNHWEMLCLLEGSANITAGNRLYAITAGNIAFFAPNEIHCIQCGKNAHYLTVTFNIEGPYPSALEGAVVRLTDREWLIIEEICFLLNNTEDPHANQQLYPLLELLLLRCCTKERQPPSVTERDAALFLKAVEILQENVASPISVTELAGALSISLSHLKRIFARYAQMGVHEYLTDLKINYAKDLLKSGNSVTQTALLAGFANQAYFSAAFKRVTGLSPKEYTGTPRVRQAPKAPKKPKPIHNRELPSYLL